MKKKISILFIALIILGNVCYLGLNYATNNIFPYSIIKPSRITIADYERKYPGNISPDSYKLKWADCNITVEDTLKLKGWFIFSGKKKPKGTIFMLHGIGSCRSANLLMASYFAADGFNVALYDARAHGYSGGVYCTFGFNEVKDLSRYIDSVSIRYPGSAPYGVFGHSLGASVGLQAIAADKRLQCGVFESPFASLKEIVRDYFARKAYLHINSIPDAALKNAEKIAGFRADEINPGEIAKSIEAPVMIVHGIQDKHVSPIYGKRIYNNLASRNKAWYPVYLGEHNNLFQTGGKNLRIQIVKFFNNFLVQP